MLTIRYSRAAEADLATALARHERESSELGDRFMAAVIAAENRCIQNPEQHGRWPGAPPERNILRGPLLKPFPYSLAFEVHPPEVVIVAVVHHRQMPLFWADR